MKSQIQQQALALGFDACHFTTALPPETGPKLQSWLDSKQHGEMAYLERNAHKRLDPQLVLHRARSIITLAVSYATKGDHASRFTPHASPPIARSRTRAVAASSRALMDR